MQSVEQTAMPFRGCLRVCRGQEVLREQASGFADLANQVPNTQETRFATASCGKVFVAVAILQLIDRKLLGLEDRLGDLVDFDLHAIDPDITVAQLLSHTSGIPDGPRTNIFSVDAKGTGAGGAFTTTGDICRFWQALFDHRLLTPEMTAQMLENHSGEADGYGYGIWRMNTPGGTLPYIQGSDPGVSFVSTCDPRGGLICVLVSNYGDDVWGPLDQVLRTGA